MPSEGDGLCLFHPPTPLRANEFLSKSLGVSQGVGFSLSGRQEVSHQVGGQLVGTPIEVQSRTCGLCCWGRGFLGGGLLAASHPPSMVGAASLFLGAKLPEPVGRRPFSAGGVLDVVHEERLWAATRE